MRPYLDIVRYVLENGEYKENRTGTDTFAVAGVMFKHDMRGGFPLLTTKQMARKSILVELEGFIKGVTDKEWYQKRGCHIWDEWCNPQKVPYGHDEETKRRMLEERDLGRIYGAQWRDFGGVDQLAKLVNTLVTDPNSRRMIVSAWNPPELGQMALEPCHWGYQVTVIGDRLHLLWNQRSVDTMLGLPFNIASYATLLHLLSLHVGIEAGTLTGFLGDTHIYADHIEGAREQIEREPLPLPHIETRDFTSIFDWEHTQTTFREYKHHPKIEFPIAV